MRKLLTVVLFLFPFLCHAQSEKLFTADRELSSSLINKIYQDRNGMIWIATEYGLNRFDGAKFTVYKHDPENEHSLCHNYVRTLFEDSKGNFYIGTYNGLQIYNPATDTFSPSAKWSDGAKYESNVVNMMERRNGEIWASGNFLCTVTVVDGIPVLENTDLPISNTMTDFMVEDMFGNIWITKRGSGVFRISPDGTWSNYLKDEKGMTVVDICKGLNGDIYLGTIGKGLIKYEREKDEFIPIPYKGMENLPVKSLFAASENEMYIGTDGNGIKTFDIGKNQISDYRYASTTFDTEDAKVHSILKDNDGNLWLAIYQKGVLMIPSKSNSFKYIGYKSIDKNFIGDNCITSIFRDSKGILWVGTDNDGIYGISRDYRKRVHFPHTDDPYSVPSTVFKIYEDSKGRLWFGSFTRGMGTFDRTTGICTYLRSLTDANGNHVQRVYDFVEDDHGRLWIATMGAGLFYYDLKTDSIAHVDFDVNPINNWIGCLHLSGNNTLYAGSYDGVSIIDLAPENYSADRIMGRHIILSMHEDRSGNLWIGSSDGLSLRDGKSGAITSFSMKDGLPSDAVNAIQSDDQDNLWISTNAGISQFNLLTHKFINYYVGDGLQGNEFSKNASFKDDDGSLWFGGMNGITYFNPQEITNPAKQWNLRITDFYIHGQPVRKGTLSSGNEVIDTTIFEARDFHLSSRDNSFTIEFSTKELSNPERIIYFYSMDDAPWTSLPQGTNRVSFSNLSPGTYHFRVKAQDYMVDSEATGIDIHISPPLWLSWWAKLSFYLIIFGIITFIIIQVRHRYRTKQEILQHIHAEQINEAKLQFFINISHEIRTPMSLIISPLQKLMSNDPDDVRQRSYRTIYRNTERILRLVNQLMDIRKIDKGQMSLIFREMDIIGFINDLYDIFVQQTMKKGISLIFNHEGIEGLKLWIDPANFDKIIMNVLSNAVKFTPDNGNIEILLRTGIDHFVQGPLKRYAEISVTDDGIGIPTEERKHIFERFYQIHNSKNNSNIGTGIGLHLTRSLVELHHGTISVETPPSGNGSRFIIRIPLGNSHLRPDELDQSHPDHTTPRIAKPTIPISESNILEDEGVKRPKTKYQVLIVEDDQEIRHYIKDELSSEYHIIESNNGKEALEAIFKNIPDLVISDIMMPEMDGMTLCRKIKQNVNLNHIPVILLTAKVREEDTVEGLETGADSYITKPFSIEILRKTISSLIRNREKLRNTFSGNQTREESLETIEALSPDDKLMGRIMKVINKNIGNTELTVEMIASEVGISRVHLHRKLKELTNQTTRDFIRNMRLKQAAKLLSEKRYPIAEVAELTGFANPNNFATAFKELYGMSPTKYMEEHLR